MKVIDLTHTICEDMPVYPGTEQPKLTVVNTCEADGFRESLLQLYSHTGTHIDPPAHLFPDGRTLDQFPPEQFLGKALVIDCRHLKAGERITADCLKPYGDKVRQADFLLLKKSGVRLTGEARAALEQAAAAGLKVCTLGSRILRCEAAPLCALSAVMYASGEF